MLLFSLQLLPPEAVTQYAQIANSSRLLPLDTCRSNHGEQLLSNQCL